ncbi:MULTISPECIES: hypothetical protein [Frankia]|nr:MULTISPECIES: hypothetical protein [Frankia]
MSGILGGNAGGLVPARVRRPARVTAPRRVLTRRRFVDYGILASACCRPC